MRSGLRKLSVGVSSLSLWRQSHTSLMYRSRRNKSLFAHAPSFFHLIIVKHLPTVSPSLPLQRSPKCLMLGGRNLRIVTATLGRRK